ncbi:MAG: beta tubulin [Methylobacterium sp.]|nr:MAG: beta tubulin [Methylobacterium sp.]
MKVLPTIIAQGLASGVTTHCQCWLLTRADGVALGFTDHDRSLSIDGHVFEAASGIEPSSVESETGLAAANGEITGALTSARITAADIEAGRYDGAELRRWLVDWTAPALDCLIDVVTIGEIRRRDGAFVAETRNALHALDLEQGRLYSSTCPAELGDADCGVNLADPAWRVATQVLSTDGRHRVSAPAFATPVAGLFARGRLMVVTGANAGLSRPIRVHDDQTITLWEGLPADLLPGDSVVAIAGCDKRFATCRDRFGNALNFRGFPLIPAPEFAFVYAQPGEGRHLGRPLVQL